MIECVELGGDARRVVIMQAAGEHGCPRCGVVIGGAPFDVRESVIKDLPFGERPLTVVWRKRRYRCPESSCGQRVFVERSSEIMPGRRSSERLRRALARADAECRAYSRVAAEYRVSWWLVNDVAVRAAAELPVEPPPVRWLGIDETRTRRPRWVKDEDSGKWRLDSPWMTSLTDLDLAHGRVILGLTPGRSSAAVCAWLKARGQVWREQVEVVAIDPCAAYANAVRKALPGRGDRGRSLPPVAAGERDGDRRAAARHLGQPRPPRAADRPGVGQPAPAAHRQGTPLARAIRAHVERDR